MQNGNFHIFFQNHCAKFIQNLHKAILDKSNPSYIVQMKFIACIPREIMIAK